VSASDLVSASDSKSESGCACAWFAFFLLKKVGGSKVVEVVVVVCAIESVLKVWGI
jgi:hypothetical protein